MESKEKNTGTATPQAMRNVFAIIMIIVYVGVGLMLLFNWFHIIYDPNWNILRWIGGPILILYGIWRAYRQFRGLD